MISISIVDDDEKLRQSISEFVDAVRGFHCISAYSRGEEAIQHLPSDKPDIVLMDINMPGMNGIECVTRLKALMPETRIVMLTVYEDTEQIFKALSAGASGYLLKRASPAKLIEAIREVYAGGAAMTSSIAAKVIASFQKAPKQEADAEALAPREKQVLQYLAEGAGYKHIADQMKISLTTVQTYIRRIYDKLHVQSRTQAVNKYFGR